MKGDPCHLFTNPVVPVATIDANDQPNTITLTLTDADSRKPLIIHNSGTPTRNWIKLADYEVIEMHKLWKNARYV